MKVHQGTRHVELDGVGAACASFWDVRSEPLSTSCCWLVRCGRYARPTQPCPSARWSTISRSSVFGGQNRVAQELELAPARPASSQAGCEIHQEVQGSQQLIFLCGQSCGCGWPLSACRQRGQNGTSRFHVRKAKCPQRCGGRGWRNPKGV